MEERLYRVGIEQLLLVKDEIVLSFTIKFKLFDIKKRTEILFEKFRYKTPCSERPLIRYRGHSSKYKDIDGIFITTFVKCSFDKKSENYIKVEVFKEKLEKKGYYLEYEIEKYFKEDEGDKTLEISKEKFIHTIKEDLKKFDTKENKYLAGRYFEVYPVGIMTVNMWFLYGHNGFKNHAKNNGIVDLIIYSHDESEETLLEFYQKNSNWKLILSNNNCWIWKTDEQKLIEVPINRLILMPKDRYIRYKYFESIEKKYLKNPYTDEEIIKYLEPSDEILKRKFKIILTDSQSKNFYITEWIQNGIR